MTYSPNWIAGGNINPSRFVKVDTTSSEPYQVLQSSTNEQIVGVSQEGTRQAPGLPGSTTYAGEDTYTLHVFGPGEVALIELGGSVTQGDYLVSDVNGKATTASLTGGSIRRIGGIALENGSSGEKIRMLILPQVAYFA